MVLSWGKALQRRILNLLLDKTVFLTLIGFLTLIIISVTWLGEKWIVVSFIFNSEGTHFISINILVKNNL